MQYDYTLKILKKNEGEFDENTSSWIVGLEEWIDISKCRDEPNGSGAKITTTDGQVYSFGSMIYLPKGTDGIKSGDRIKVEDKGGNIRIEADVVRFSKDHFHSRIWV